MTQNCPESLGQLQEGASFGDTKLKLIEVAGIYYKCREAALNNNNNSENKNGSK